MVSFSVEDCAKECPGDHREFRHNRREEFRRRSGWHAHVPRRTL